MGISRSRYRHMALLDSGVQGIVTTTLCRAGVLSQGGRSDKVRKADRIELLFCERRRMIGLTELRQLLKKKLKPIAAIELYKGERRSGASPLQATVTIKRKFALTIGQAKAIMAKEETGLSLADYQDQLLEGFGRESEVAFQLGESDIPKS